MQHARRFMYRAHLSGYIIIHHYIFRKLPNSNLTYSEIRSCRTVDMNIQDFSSVKVTYSRHDMPLNICQAISFLMALKILMSSFYIQDGYMECDLNVNCKMLNLFILSFLVSRSVKIDGKTNQRIYKIQTVVIQK